MNDLLLLSVLALAFVNGANDNMKGVATLIGSRSLSYQSGVLLATLSTVLGCLASGILATSLLHAFSGKGLVPSDFVTTSFLAAVAIAATITLAAATVIGMPVSTTHAIVGSLVGAGWLTAGSSLNLTALGWVFLFPLLLGPVAALVMAWGLSSWGRRLSVRYKIKMSDCLCLNRQQLTPATESGATTAERHSRVSVVHRDSCAPGYEGYVWGIEVEKCIKSAHCVAGGLVGFAHGLNDTPKLLGLVVGVSALSPTAGVFGVTTAMALGGLFGARKVAETLSKKLTDMTPGQGVAGGFSTALLMLVASPLGLPMSTTHVSTGSIVGIGMFRQSVRWPKTFAVLGAWIVTLPLAAGLGALLVKLLP